MAPDTEAAEQSILQHWDCIATVVDKVFSHSCGTQIDIVDDGPTEAPADQSVMVAIISFVGDIEWSVFFIYPEKTATAVASSFAGFDISYDSEDMPDAIGEMANIVAGGIKLMLSQRGTRVEISLPTVISGTGLRLRILQGISSWKECFECDHGRFWTGVFLGNEKRINGE